MSEHQHKCAFEDDPTTDLSPALRARHRHALHKNLTEAHEKLPPSSDPWSSAERLLTEGPRKVSAFVDHDPQQGEYFFDLSPACRSVIERLYNQMRLHYWRDLASQQPGMEQNKKGLMLQLRTWLETRSILATRTAAIKELWDKWVEDPMHLVCHVVKLSSVEAEGRECSICLNTMGSSDEDGVVEDPVRLHCQGNHIMGIKCVKRWVDEQKSHCPLCRGLLIPNMHSRLDVTSVTPFWLLELNGGVDPDEAR